MNLTAFYWDGYSQLMYIYPSIVIIVLTDAFFDHPLMKFYIYIDAFIPLLDSYAPTSNNIVF